MPNWKVQLLGEGDTLTKLALANKTKEIYISSDGPDCFLESTDFAMSTDHLEVKEKAASIIDTLIASGGAPAGAAI
ncbi:MAG: hypothetical protein K2X29_03140, partial [Candidatus Obscuribacterales bacterium]|nr:hypothetical protein [Candidatus Obscuribacterales bacterium]